MPRVLVLFVLAAMAAHGQPDVPDRAFNDIRFEDWLHGRDDTSIHWSLRIVPPFLRDGQILEVDVLPTIDGTEFAKRPGPGQMVFFLQVRDREGATYQSHRVVTLNEKTSPSAVAKVKLAERFCVVPGQYQIAAALYDTVSKEHSLKTTDVRVPELHDDPLPDIWRGFPSIAVADRVCFSQRLHLPVKTETPVRIDVVVNRPANVNANIDARLRVIAEMDVSNGWMRVSSLDLQNRKIMTRKVDESFNPNRLWLRALNNNRYTVDVHALENEAGGAQFFVSEVRKILDGPISEPEHVLIVLTDPKKFPKGEDLRPIQTKLPPGTHVFYIRSDYPQHGGGPIPISAPPGPQDWSTPPELPSGTPSLATRPEPGNFDSLERTLEPLHPRAFHVTTAGQFRHALGEILNEISQK